MKSIYVCLFSIVLTFTSCSTIEKQSMDQLIVEFEKLQDELDTDLPWPTFDETVLSSEKENLSSLLEKLGELADDDLSEEDRINKDMLVLIIQDRIEALKFRIHEFPLNAEGGFLTGIIYSINGTRISDEESKKEYLEKLNELPGYIDERIGHLRSGIERKVVSPKLITELCLSMVEDVAKGTVEESFFLHPAKGSTIEEEVKEIISTLIIPAYQRLSAFISQEYLQNAQDEIGVRSIPGGEVYYEHRVRYFATDDITPEEVFEIGMSEVKRIRAEMEEIIKEVNFEGSFSEFQDYLRTSPQFYAKSPEEILSKAAWITKQMEGKLPRFFGKLPRMPLTVKPVPAAIAPNYTSGRYSEGSYDDKKAGEYWVNTTKLDCRPLYSLTALSLHEGVPGHHTQIMLAAEMDMPDFRRNTYLSAFGEGWALYCEYLGKEAVAYTTAYENFGRLVYEMWRACRLVVDPGMHYLGWSREEAFNFMKENTALSILEIENEINRYIGWPAQAISYKLGELKIKELRSHAEVELGDNFEITDFHDAILGNGSVPLNTLDRIIKNWVKDQKMQ